MGQLNSLIKFVVFNANALLFLGGVGTIVVGSLIITSGLVKLAEAYIFLRGLLMVASGSVVTIMSVIGCWGTHRQILRDYPWSGRRVLSLYQVILVAVVVWHGLIQIGLYSIEVNLQEAAEELPNEYGEFEDQFRTGFNEAYYQQECYPLSGKGSWIWELAEQHCPYDLSEETCLCSSLESGDTSRRCSDRRTYDKNECCPSEELCQAGMDAACPYSACRTGILQVLLDYITPARRYATFVFALEGTSLILTCLLICYNPRDSTEDILVKSGALVRGSPSSTMKLDVGGNGNRNMTPPMNDDIFDLQLAQTSERAMPAATLNDRGRGRGRGRETSFPSSALPDLVTSLTSTFVENPPSEPLRQFMSPVPSGNSLVIPADSPGSPGDEEEYEFQNMGATRRPDGSKFSASIATTTAASVGPRKTTQTPLTLAPGPAAIQIQANLLAEQSSNPTRGNQSSTISAQTPPMSPTRGAASEPMVAQILTHPRADPSLNVPGSEKPDSSHASILPPTVRVAPGPPLGALYATSSADVALGLSLQTPLSSPTERGTELAAVKVEDREQLATVAQQLRTTNAGRNVVVRSSTAGEGRGGNAGVSDEHVELRGLETQAPAGTATTLTESLTTRSAFQTQRSLSAVGNQPLSADFDQTSSLAMSPAHLSPLFPSVFRIESMPALVTPDEGELGTPGVAESVGVSPLTERSEAVSDAGSLASVGILEQTPVAAGPDQADAGGLARHFSTPPGSD